MKISNFNPKWNLFKKIHSELASIVSDFFPSKNYVVYSAKKKRGIKKKILVEIWLILLKFWNNSPNFQCHKFEKKQNLIHSLSLSLSHEAMKALVVLQSQTVLLCIKNLLPERFEEWERERQKTIVTLKMGMWYHIKCFYFNFVTYKFWWNFQEVGNFIEIILGKKNPNIFFGLKNEKIVPKNTLVIFLFLGMASVMLLILHGNVCFRLEELGFEWVWANIGLWVGPRNGVWVLILLIFWPPTWGMEEERVENYWLKNGWTPSHPSNYQSWLKLKTKK